MNDLKNKAISGMFWSFLQRFGTKGISLLTMILLARILTPKDFGLIAMIMIILQISQAVIDGGFNLALIQKKDADDDDYSSVFYINLIGSFILYVLVFFTADLISYFFDQPLLTKLIRVLSLVFIVNAFSFVQETKLTKEIKFKTLAIIHIPSVIFGGVVALVSAFGGLGVWSIVFMQLSTRLTYTIQIWIYSNWYPRLKFNWKKAKMLFSFGSKLLISNIVTAIYNNIFVVTIGRFYPVSSVGYYQNATNLTITPASTLTSALTGVFFPVFSQIQDDNPKLKSGYKRLLQDTFFLVCPVFVLSGLLAKPLFGILLGDKWLPAIPYFRWLCVVGVLYPLNVIKLSIPNIKGRRDVFLKVEMIRRIAVTIAIAGSIIFLNENIINLLIIQAFEYVFMFFLFGYYCGVFIQYSIFEQIRDLLPIFLLNILTGVIVFCLVLFLKDLSDINLFTIGFGAGILFYYGASSVLRFSWYLDLRSIFLNRVRSIAFVQMFSKI